MICKEVDAVIFSYYFYKQPVYKQLVLGWQIAKQVSGINPFWLSNNEICRLKKKWSFSFVINKK